MFLTEARQDASRRKSRITRALSCVAKYEAAKSRKLRRSQEDRTTVRQTRGTIYGHILERISRNARLELPTDSTK